MSTATVPARLRELFPGSRVDFGRGGVLHVAAVWRDAKDRARTIRIESDSPKSGTDAFLLSCVRARADVVLTTGRILREEPELLHEYLGAADERAALSEWRRTGLAAEGALPRSAVLTSGSDLPLAHPVFTQAERPPLVITGADGARTLAGAARDHGFELIELERPGPRTAIAALRDRGLATVALEAGPSTSSELYEAPALVDELLLSTFLGADLPEHLQGPHFPSDEAIEAALPRREASCERAEESGRWRFERRVSRC